MRVRGSRIVSWAAVAVIVAVLLAVFVGRPQRTHVRSLASGGASREEAAIPPPRPATAALAPDVAVRRLESHSEPAPAAPSETVDDVLGRLANGTVAFNTPDQMRLAHSQSIQASLGVKIPADTLVRSITANGTVTTATLKIGNRMQATLSGGSAFDITPAGPQPQFIGDRDVNTWEWTVTPSLEGAQELVLTFDALIDVDGVAGTHTIGTFRKAIKVVVGWPETPGEWADWFKNGVEYIGWFWTTLLLPAGLFVRKWLRRPEPAAPRVADKLPSE